MFPLGSVAGEWSVSHPCRFTPGKRALIIFKTQLKVQFRYILKAYLVTLPYIRGSVMCVGYDEKLKANCIKYIC
jgi:hypothetical protein